MVVQTQNVTLNSGLLTRKIIRGPSRAMVSTCVKASSLNIKRKWSYHTESVQSLKFEFDLLTLDFIEVLLMSYSTIYVKYHHFMSNRGVIVQNSTKFKVRFDSVLWSFDQI